MIKIQDVLDFAAAGLSVIPIKADGSKSPAIPSWKQYQLYVLNEMVIRRSFVNKYAGALAGGYS